MKLRAVASIVLFMTFTTLNTLLVGLNAKLINDAILASGQPATTLTAADSEWDKAVLSGGNLWAGMHSDDGKVLFLFRTDLYAHEPTFQSVHSAHDGDMVEEFTKWAYNEDEVENTKIDKDCDFNAYHMINQEFDEFGIKTAPKANGGPNQCVQVDHQDGPKVLRDEHGNLSSVADQTYIDDSYRKEYT
jgi:hypothetical protein